VTPRKSKPDAESLASENPLAAAPPQRARGFVPRGAQREGLSLVMDSSNAPLKDLAVHRLRMLKTDKPYAGKTGNRETLLHVLIGQCDIDIRGPFGQQKVTKLGERPDVFSGLPSSVVLGADCEYRVKPLTRSLDIAVAAVPLDGTGVVAPAIIRPQDVRVHEIGEAHWRRHVREVLGGDSPAIRLRAGETINPPGLWSSWPHHDFHANPKLAPKFEEVFLYFMKPRYGWGLQKRAGLFCDLEPVDDVLVVRNGDATIMPLGDHPVVAGVENQLMYIWFYVSPIPKIYSKWAEDVGGYA
jgi:5-deoxy-glucuronate isomerase